jgi:hypothetical protein
MGQMEQSRRKFLASAGALGRSRTRTGHIDGYFMFANEVGGFLDTDNYRKRVLHKLARELELPKLTSRSFAERLRPWHRRRGR